MSVRDVQRDAQRAVERGNFLRRKRTDVIGQRRLRQAHHLVAMNAAFVRETLADPRRHLRGQTVERAVDRRAHDGRIARVDQHLPAHHHENAKSPRVAARGVPDPVQLAALQSGSW